MPNTNSPLFAEPNFIYHPDVLALTAEYQSWLTNQGIDQIVDRLVELVCQEPDLPAEDESILMATRIDGVWGGLYLYVYGWKNPQMLFASWDFIVEREKDIIAKACSDGYTIGIGKETVRVFEVATGFSCN